MTQETEQKPEIVLTEDQTAAVEAIEEWLDAPGDKLRFTLGGYAGTGKTTTIKALLERLDEKEIRSSVMSFTGKAVSVLRRKGVEKARTIHNTIYHLNPDTGEFELSYGLGADVIIVDEASMISRDLYSDLSSFEIPVLYVGDMGQLEPVGDDPRLMEEPDFVLDTIHRQAQNSPIIQFAERIRFNMPYTYGRLGDELKILPSRELDSYIDKVDQVICGFNRTKNSINTSYRQEKYGHANKMFEDGEKIVCMRNNSRFGVFNGTQAKVIRTVSSYGTVHRIDLELDDGKIVESIPADIGVLHGAESVPKGVRLTHHTTYWDFAYCTTCHKAQGSEWDSVAVLVEPSNLWNQIRWNYTAVTRAAKKLLFCVG